MLVNWRLLSVILLPVLVACGGPAEERASPSSTASRVDRASATASVAPSATAISTPTSPARVTVTTFDASVPPGVLVIDYGPREGWNSGGAGAARGALVGLDAATGGELDWWEPLNTGQYTAREPSPDGRFVAFSGSYDFILETATGTRRPLPDEVPGLELLTWAADGEMVYGTFERIESSYTSSTGLRGVRGTEFWAVDAVSGEARMIGDGDFQVRTLRASPGGDLLYALAYRSEQCCGIDIEGAAFVAAIDIGTGAIRAELSLPGLVVGQRFEERGQEGSEMNILRSPGVALAPDGSRLYIAHADGGMVTTIDAARMTVVSTVVPERPKSAMGRLKSWAGGLLISDAKAKGGAYFTMEAAVSPDGRWLYVTGSGAEICETDEWFPCVDSAPMGLRIIDVDSMELVAEFEGIGHMVFTPDGGRVVGWGLAYDSRVSGDTDEQVRYGPFVIDTASQELTGQVEPPVAGPGLAVSRDGRYGYTVRSEFGSASVLVVIDLETASVVAERAYATSNLSLVGLVAGP